MATWTLKVKFRDMFFLVNYKPDKVTGLRQGAVVLLPHGDGQKMPHTASVSIGDPSYQIGLTQTEVTFYDNSGTKAWGHVDVNTSQLPCASTIFGTKISLPKNTIAGGGACVPLTLNARVVLGGGSLVAYGPRDPDADMEWTFTRPDGSTYKSLLTDRLEWQRHFTGSITMVLSSPYRKDIEVVLEPKGSELVLEFWNRDVKDLPNPTKPIAGTYVLAEYNVLHALFGRAGDNVVPKGDYPKGSGPYPPSPNPPTNPIATVDPICGGEQGCPDPEEAPKP